MDNKLIEQYGGDILCYRLRTARQKKRMQYKDFDKQLLRLRKEETALYQKEEDLGWELLEPPIQRGWMRFFVLRDDVARCRHTGFFEKILERINTTQLCDRKDFKKKKRKRGRRIYVAKEQTLKRLTDWEFRKMEFTIPEQSFFYEVIKTERNGVKCKYYYFSEPWRFVLRVRPHIIYKVKKEDCAIESRLKEIQAYLKCNAYDRRQEKLLCGSIRYRDKALNKPSDPFYEKSLKQILDLIHE
ncbi:MAG: hypothetical protein QM731_10410 [Chitinophagaceae bacterium]